MDREGYTDDTKFFIGTEVEKSPAYGQRTLFVIGLQNPKEILARALNNNCPHIYLGANQSFEITGEHGTDAEQAGWDLMVNLCIGAGYLVTLDFDLEDLEWVQESGYSENNNFIPMISVKVPYIEQLGYNANIKIDDVDFNATNKGVWTHSVHSLMDPKKVTNWIQYKQDEIIE